MGEIKKIANITFHGAHNFGSNLQAFALQEYIKKICPNCEYKIINLRTDIQKSKYRTPFEKKGLKNNIKKILLFSEKKNLLKKKELFEEFINKKLNLTEEVKNIDEIRKLDLKYDYYISGSDQVWNLKAPDFEWANYLEFVESGKKISYAASFGPTKQEWNEEQKNRIKKDLLEFSNISVREVGSFNNVNELTGLEPSINLDPTFLLNKDTWINLINKERLIKYKYILLYDLKQNKETFCIAKKMSKKLKLPIVIINGDLKAHLKFGFKHFYACGPLEFLNLIENAELVLSSSFHGNVFSIILQKNFFAINGIKDFRINTLLSKMKLEDRSVSIEDIERKINKVDILNTNFDTSISVIEQEEKKSRAYLKEALDIEKG